MLRQPAPSCGAELTRGTASRVAGRWRTSRASAQEELGRRSAELPAGPRIADNLQNRGWLVREPHAQDRRAVHLVLTQAGQTAAARVAGARRARMATLLDAVPADERDGVLRALDVLTHSLTSPPTSQDRPHVC